MSKKLLVAIIAIFIVGAAAFFILSQKEDPLVTQAKGEVQRANDTYLAFQNRVNAIPALEISQDVKNDFRMESAFFGIIGYIVPGVEGPGSPEAEAAFSEFANAQRARESGRIPAFSLGNPFEQFLQSAEAIGEVTAEDLVALERLADTFAAAVANVRADVPELPPLTVAKNEKTEKQFQELERIRTKHEGLSDSLEGYGSGDFRAEVERLKVVNAAFRGFPRYVAGLVGGTAGGYSLDFTRVFPEAAAEETAVKDCVFRPNKTGCAPAGPFPGHLQELSRILAGSYGDLVE